MKGAEPCPICSQPGCTECRSSMVRFFGLLRTVHERNQLVSREQATSQQPNVMGCGIDKINGYMKVSVAVDELKDRAARHQFGVKRVFLKDRRAYLEIGREKLVAHFKLDRAEQIVTNIVSNPNRFSSWPKYITFLDSVLSPEESVNLQITRMDLNLDFAMPLADLMKSLDFDFKRNSSVHKHSSGVVTGATIGRGACSISVYDKAAEQNSDHPWSRVELILTKEALPTRFLHTVPSALLTGNFFEGVRGVTVKPTDSATILNDSQRSKLNSFCHILNREGFFQAKKAMDESRNFTRDFGKLVRIAAWPIQPQTIFQREIQKFIQPEGDLSYEQARSVSIQ